MTSKQLAEILLKNPDDIVVTASDPEGNSFSEVHDVSLCYNFDKQDQVIGYRELTPQLEAQGYCEEDVLEGVKCVVIWP